MINIENPDKHFEDDGIWTPFGGSKFLIANTNNFAFQKLFARLQLPYRKKIDKGTLDPKIGLDIMCESLSRTILLDWKDVTDASQEVVSYSDELGKQALINNSDLRDFVREFAGEIENYRKEMREELGNS